jgi:hypothetical protein
MPHVFERKKSGVAFVHMVNRGLQANRLQRSVAADSKQNLLPDSHLVVAAVQLVGQIALFGTRISLCVRI